MCCHLFGIIGKRQIYNALTILCLYMKTIEIEDGYFFFIRKLSGSRCFNTAVTCADVIFLFMCGIFLGMEVFHAL